MRVIRTIGLSLAGLVILVVLFLIGSILFMLSTRHGDFTRQRERLQTPRAPIEAVAGTPVEEQVDPGLRLNQIQMVATHNSYHLQSDPLRLFCIGLFEPVWPARLRYSHAALSDQFDHGVRSIELDVRNQGSRFVIAHVPLVDDRTTGRPSPISPLPSGRSGSGPSGIPATSPSS